MKITIGEETLDIPESKIKELKEEFGYRGDRPNMGESYCVLYRNGTTTTGTWNDTPFENEVLAQGNAFWGPTKEKDCEMAKLRKKAAANGWVPEEREKFWMYGFIDKTIHRRTFVKLYMHELDSGNIHRTEQDAIDWGKKYHDAFMWRIERNEKKLSKNKGFCERIK